MPSHNATFESYDLIPVEMPGGRVIECRALVVKEAAHYFRLLVMARDGDAEAHFKILEEFPAAVGFDIDRDRLTAAEVFVVLDRFLSHRRTLFLEMAGATQEPSGATSPESTSGLMT